MLILGLLCILLGWTFQFVEMLGRHYAISWVFVASYCIGTLMVVTDGYVNNQMTTANISLLSLIMAACVLIMLSRKHLK